MTMPVNTLGRSSNPSRRVGVKLTTWHLDLTSYIYSCFSFYGLIEKGSFLAHSMSMVVAVCVSDGFVFVGGLFNFFLVSLAL